MNRSLLVGLLAFFLVFVGLLLIGAGWLVLSIPLVVYLLEGLLRGPEKVVLEAERTLSQERTNPGVPVIVTLRVTNHGPTLEQLILSDPLPAFLDVVEGSPSRMMTLRHGETLTWHYTVQGRRGYHAFRALSAIASDRLGVFTRRLSIPTSGQLLILPPVPRLRNLVIRPRVTRVYAGAIPAQQGGPGVEFFGVRDYQPGDPPRWINWRASAHHERTLFSNEYQQERVADVGIVLDARRRVNEFRGGRSLFEHSVLATASLADAFLDQGNRVGLMVYGQFINWLAPDYGKLQRERLLQALARAQPGESQAFSGLVVPPRLFPAMSQIVLVSPLLDDDVSVLLRLCAGGYSLIVVSPNPVQYEKNLLPASPAATLAARILHVQREVTLQRLRHAGVRVVDWDVECPLENLVESALSHPPAFLRAILQGGGRK